MNEIWKNDATICGHAGEETPAPLHAVVPPIYMNSLHTFDTIEDHLNNNGEGYVYGRCSNPTTALLETKLAALEHGAGALCFGSGMAAITSAIMACLLPGEHAVAMRNSYGPAQAFLRDQMAAKYGASVTFIEGTTVEQFREAMRPETKLFYIESPASVTFALTDIRGVCALAKEHGIRVIIDNTWATPLYQKPLDMGADISVHTLSKYIGGHSDIIGGAAICKDEEMYKNIRDCQRQLWGGILGAFDSWLVLRGLRSLPARLALHSKNAMAVAEALEFSPKIERVNYPGLKSFPQHELAEKQLTGYSGLMSFIPNMSFEETCAAVNRLKIFRIGVSWGGFESLVCMAMAHSTEEEARANGGAKNMVRISVGQEDVRDLIDDLTQAFGL